MRWRPIDLADEEVARAVGTDWGLDVRNLEHVPVGGGAYHWLAEVGDGTRRWISVDDLDNKPYIATNRDSTFASLAAALDTARRLQADGLEFVLAPLAAHSRPSVCRLSSRYAISVFPYVEATPGTFGTPLPLDVGRRLAHSLARLHAAADRQVPRAPVDFASRDVLEGALHALDEQWDEGPFAEPTRLVLAANADLAHRLIERFDALMAHVLSASNLVVTHGEPHSSNVLVTESGHVWLVDWDTLGMAPPERDLWHIGADALAEYVEQTRYRVDPLALRFYRLRWLMEDITLYLRLLRVPHTDTPENANAYRAVEKSLAPEAAAPHLA